jgi:hypothetical protein
MMIIPPLALPFGGKMKRIDRSKYEYTTQERSYSSKHRSLSRHDTQTIKINY